MLKYGKRVKSSQGGGEVRISHNTICIFRIWYVKNFISF